MDIKIKSNFRFTVAAIEYTPGGELYITLESDIGDRVEVDLMELAIIKFFHQIRGGKNDKRNRFNICRIDNGGMFPQ